MPHKIVNGQQVELTAQEIADNQARATEWESQAKDRAMADLRQRRNQLLAETDWSVLPDVPLTSSQKSTMVNYRTTLRNITDGLETVEDVEAVQLPGIPVL